MHRTIIGLAALLAPLVAACQSAQPTGASVAAGQLGNGGFAFECDDSVACDRYSHTAKSFPDAIALSSTFRIRYVPKDTSSSGTGITVGAVGTDFLSPSGTGMTAIQAGWGTVVARDSAGKIVEFVTVPIVKADKLVVYDAAYTGDTPTAVTSVTLAQGETKSFRALAREKQLDLAGALAYEWTAPPGNGVVQVDAQLTGKVAITGLRPGTATVTVAGAAKEESISVTVQP